MASSSGKRVVRAKIMPEETSTISALTSVSTNISEPHIQEEQAVVVMPLDASPHSEYCLYFYIKYIHKHGQKVLACYVAEDFLRVTKNNTSSSALISGQGDGKGDDKVVADENSEEKPAARECCACFRSSGTLFDKVVVDVGPSPGVLGELAMQDRISQHKVKHKTKRLFRANNVAYEFHRLTGPDPWTAILAFQKQVNGTMIVMGSRGLGTLKRNLFGSVSDKVLRGSPVPVLVVKKPSGITTPD